MVEPRPITVVVNGEPQPAATDQTLLALLERLGEPIDKGVVEHNGRYVRRGDLDGVDLTDGDRVEVILPAFGG
jgi:thiamine biosynthesis protein ThiS